MKDLIGDLGGRVMSLLAIALFVSATSAMIFVGPRVYAAMASDGLLPRMFQGRPNRPPASSIVLQSALSIALIFTHRVQQVLQNVGAVLTLSAAVTAACLFRVRFGEMELPRPSIGALVSAAVYVVAAILMLCFGVRNSPLLAGWIGAILLVAATAYRLQSRKR
jgi:APA family basic amino acid/polyamine antiporter